jgi:hypothetical protein
MILLTIFHDTLIETLNFFTHWLSENALAFWKK